MVSRPEKRRRVRAVGTPALPGPGAAVFASPDGVKLVVDPPGLSLTFATTQQAATVGASLVAGAFAHRDGTTDHADAVAGALEHVRAVLAALDAGEVLDALDPR